MAAKIKTFVEKRLKIERAVLAGAVGMLYVTFPNRIYSSVLSPPLSWFVPHCFLGYQAVGSRGLHWDWVPRDLTQVSRERAV